MIGTMEKLTEMVQDLTEDETCPVCRAKFLIACPEHELVWNAQFEDMMCETCDGFSGKPERISCPCQNHPA